MKTKYKNVKTVVDGITFDSKKEAKIYRELKLLQRAEIIFDLVLQPRFDIEINDVKICTYIADFEYLEIHHTFKTVEDCKGFKTPVYNLKKKLMKVVFGINILET